MDKRDIESMIRAYMSENDIATYDESTLEELQLPGSSVSVWERSSCGHYRDHHLIDLLDLLAWIYSKIDS